MNWAINTLKPQLTKRREGGREGGVRGVIAPNQSLCSEAFGEMKQYSASTV